jgi:hypothetical protein
MAYVYKHIRLDNGEVFYIGISKDNNYKRSESKKYRNYHWHNIVNKVGFKTEIVYDNITIHEAAKKEIDLINFYGRKDLGRGPLVNMTDGGEGSLNMAEETKQKLRDLMIGKTIENHWTKRPEAKAILSERIKGDKNPACRSEVKQKISDAKKGKKNPKFAEYAKTRIGDKNAFYGKTHSAEFKQMMRELKTGVPLSEQHKINLSIAMKNRPAYDYKDKQKECPHCGLIGGGGNMKRYHFDNCKSLQK